MSTNWTKEDYPSGSESSNRKKAFSSNFKLLPNSCTLLSLVHVRRSWHYSLSFLMSKTWRVFLLNGTVNCRKLFALLFGICPRGFCRFHTASGQEWPLQTNGWRSTRSNVKCLFFLSLDTSRHNNRQSMWFQSLAWSSKSLILLFERIQTQHLPFRSCVRI